MSKPHISATQISMFYRCAAQYAFRYEQGLIIKPPVAFIVGGSFHKCVESDLDSKMESGMLLTDEAVCDIAHDTVNKKWDAEGVELDEKEKGLGEAKVRGAAVDTTVKIALKYHTDLAPKIKPSAVEWPWRLEITGYPYDIIGFVDVRESVEGLVINPVRETKSAARKPVENQEMQLIQLTAYSAAVKVMEGDHPKISVDYVTKTKTPEIHTREVTKTDTDTQGLLQMVETVALAKERGLFPPTGLGQWFCGPFRCGYVDRCKYYRRGR